MSTVVLVLIMTIALLMIVSGVILMIHNVYHIAEMLLYSVTMV